MRLTTRVYGIARALIDPGSSALFVHKILALHLCLPRRNKNSIVEGVAGASTHTRGSVWFQVYGIEDSAESQGRSIRAKEDNQGSTPASCSGRP